VRWLALPLDLWLVTMGPTRLIAAAVALTLAACGQNADAPAASEETADRGTSSLETTFESAAKEFQVPVGLLKSIGYVETRLGGNADGSAYGGFGLMNVPAREDWNLLERAAALTAVPEARLKVDRAANIRGAAAVLRELADKAFNQYPDLNPNRLEDWFHAVSLYQGFESAPAGIDYASDVYLRLEQGFEVTVDDGTVLQLPLGTEWREKAPSGMRKDAVAEYPGALWLSSPHYTSGRTSYEYVLIHTMQGSYAGCRSWFQNPSSKVSSHYLVRSTDGQVTQMVEHRNTAWHAQCMNSKSVGIEHEGYVQDPGRWYTDAMYQSSANLTRWIADRHGIPKTRSRIIGHAEVPSACNTGGHTDPGSGWNWARYMQLVGGSAPTASTGVFIGAIYQGGVSTNRVAGASVTINGQTVQSGADGIYQFTLPPGSYTATVSKSGFSTTTVTRTVTAGAQVWGSMEINPMTASGALKGKIFVYNPANPADMTQPISGAVVTAGGQSQTTAADGMYSFTLPPATYTVNVVKAGYANNSVSRAVTASATVWGSVGLSSSSAADTQKPTVAITFPQADAQLDLAVVTLKGTASDDRGAVATVNVALNGGAATSVPVTNGAFQIDIKLKPGTNTLTVTAKDAANNTGSATSTAVFNAGVAGFVHVYGDETARVAQATVELLEQGTGSKIGTAVTDAQGAYALPVLTVGQDYVLVTRAPGFRSLSETVTVADDQRLTHNVGLVQGLDELPTDVGITFTEPLPDAVIPTASVTVYGTVRGFEVISVKVNGVQAELLGAGGFAATVPLNEGDNHILAVATGVNGETVTGLVKVTRKLVGGAQSPPAELRPVAGSCAAVPGVQLLAMLLAAGLLRRRRR
jgi:N-acetyl-anhydromuramyl-L-alanine amidase AmpD